MRYPPKLERLKAAALAQGWRIVPHVHGSRWFPPDPRVRPVTVHDHNVGRKWRTIENVAHDLRRAGLREG